MSALGLKFALWPKRLGSAKKGLAPIILLLFHYVMFTLVHSPISIQWALPFTSLFCCCVWAMVAEPRGTERSQVAMMPDRIQFLVLYWNNDCIINYVVCSRMLRLSARLRWMQILSAAIMLCMEPAYVPCDLCEINTVINLNWEQHWFA